MHKHAKFVKNVSDVPVKLYLPCLRFISLSTTREMSPNFLTHNKNALIKLILSVPQTVPVPILPNNLLATSINGLHDCFLSCNFFLLKIELKQSLITFVNVNIFNTSGKVGTISKLGILFQLLSVLVLNVSHCLFITDISVPGKYLKYTFGFTPPVPSAPYIITPTFICSLYIYIKGRQNFAPDWLEPLDELESNFPDNCCFSPFIAILWCNPR